MILPCFLLSLTAQLLSASSIKDDFVSDQSPFDSLDDAERLRATELNTLATAPQEDDIYVEEWIDEDSQSAANASHLCTSPASLAELGHSTDSVDGIVLGGDDEDHSNWELVGVQVYPRQQLPSNGASRVLSLVSFITDECIHLIFAQPRHHLSKPRRMLCSAVIFILLTLIVSFVSSCELGIAAIWVAGLELIWVLALTVLSSLA